MRQSVNIRTKKQHFFRVCEFFAVLQWTFPQVGFGFTQ